MGYLCKPIPSYNRSQSQAIMQRDLVLISMVSLMRDSVDKFLIKQIIRDHD